MENGIHLIQLIQVQKLMKVGPKWSADTCSPRNQKSLTQIFGRSFITEKTQKNRTQWKIDASNAVEALFFYGQQSPRKAVPGESQGNLDLSKTRWNIYLEENKSVSVVNQIAHP